MSWQTQNWAGEQRGVSPDRHPINRWQMRLVLPLAVLAWIGVVWIVGEVLG